MHEKEVFYVEIHNPIDLRRSLLEASRDLLKCLQKYEDLKKARSDKMKEISKLRGVMREINSILSQAKNMMPAVILKAPEPVKKGAKAGKEAKKEAERPKKKPMPEPDRKPRELSELEGQLKDIEKKLTSLG